ncbi:LysE family transporter [Nesterenkonia sphaerica]|uniref:Lysine transporter LysE n=1 Tax=Nesterenkonia sphaerica TaxID=1804988 RepID=A0A5R9AF95_9MICC|nr:LysE family transporter [Nesterenkonia sphaerica]TLP77160.1 lysine transporter LysE [Nesterenkonia sphaerica]
MIEVILTGLWLGLVFNAAPGPVFTESLRRGVREGFGPALAVQVGSLVGDAAWAVLGLAGAAALLTQPQLHIPITVGGCIVLLVLGLQGVRDAVAPKSRPAAAQTTRGGLLRGPLGAGALISLASVWNVVYWAGAGGAVGGALGDQAPIVPLLVFFAAFMSSSVIWCFVCAGLIAGLRRAVSQLWTRIIEGGAGAALIVMAVLLLVQALQAVSS